MIQSINSNQEPHNTPITPDNGLKQYRSLRIYLIVCFSGLILFVGTLTALGVYHSTRKDARALQNHNLEVIAQLVSNYHQIISPEYTDGPKSNPVNSTTKRPSILFQFPESTNDASELQEAQIIIQPLNFTPQKFKNKWLEIPATISDGFSNIMSHGEEWQVLISTTSTGQRFAVAQRAEVQNELTTNTSLRMLIPLFILLPIFILVITMVIRQAFKPVTQLTNHIDQQKDGVTLPIDNVKIPREILPFVYAINQLLTRLSNNIAQQQRFIADAAHELRTPLTALILQADNLNRAKLSPEDAERVHQLQRGLIRSQHLLEQLLSLARQQSGIIDARSRISLLTILKELLVDFLPLAEQKNIDLGVLNSEDVWVHAAMQDIQTLLRNAISNAIRYTPSGGRVDIRIYATDSLAFIEIINHGAGIPEAELSRVFDPFYRALGQVEVGSGLGLTIVQEIARRYGGQVTLRNLEYCSGVCFEFQMPMSQTGI
jgi:two-component system OmpR family sensor kinase